MIRFALVVLVGLFVFGEAVPAFAQGGEPVLMAQQQRRRTLFDMLFGEEQQVQPPARQQQRQQQPRQQAPAASAAPPTPPPAKVQKSENATRLAVFGDSMAIDLSKALERFYAEDPDLVVLDQGVSSSGFVREDFFDWDQAIAEDIAENSFDLAVVIIGINDRQEINVDRQTLKPLTPQWTEAYQARIASFLNTLRAARKPVIWVGLPPMAKADYSAAISQINTVQRLASFSGGAEFVDIYERFLGEDGRYSSYGPDVSGQNALMRKDDGIHFSSAGADKLAFYLSQSIRNFYRGGSVSIQVADPLAGTDAAAMLRPPYQGLGQTRLLEVAGAIIPINRAPQRASGLLTAGAPTAPEAAFTLDQLMSAPAGRVDAFGVGIDPAAQENPNPN